MVIQSTIILIDCYTSYFCDENGTSKKKISNIFLYHFNYFGCCQPKSLNPIQEPWMGKSLSSPASKPIESKAIWISNNDWKMIAVIFFFCYSVTYGAKWTAISNDDDNGIGCSIKTPNQISCYHLSVHRHYRAKLSTIFWWISKR